MNRKAYMYFKSSRYIRETAYRMVGISGTTAKKHTSYVKQIY